MEKIEDKKLRQQLKEVYDTFNEVKKIIFTTYDFSADFFEESLISYLEGTGKIINIVHVNALNKWLMKNNIDVYYDVHGVMNLEKRLTYNTFPISIENGVFHPKVIVIYGKKNDKKEHVHLFVSSANLTVSGYGRNIEGIYDEEIESEVCANGLALFLENLFANGRKDDSINDELLDYLSSIKGNKEESVEFYSSWNKKESLVHLLFNESLNITIISPYFSENLDSHISQINNQYNSLTLVPSIDSDGKVQIKKSQYDKLKNKIKFKKFLKGNDRFNHSKIYFSENYFVVGSHNFTGKAAGIFNRSDDNKCPDNIEASVIINEKDKIKVLNNNINNLLEDFNDIEKYLLPDETILKDDYDDENLEKIKVEVLIDWKENTYSLRYFGKERTIKININDIQIFKVKVNDEFFIEEEISDDKYKVFLKNKCFDVFDSDNGQVIFKGFINEVNWKDYRSELTCESLDELFSCLMYEDYKEQISKSYSTSIITRYEKNLDDYSEYNDFKINFTDKLDIFDNYFYLSKAYRLLRKKIRDIAIFDNSKSLLSLSKLELEHIDKDKLEKYKRDLYLLYKNLPSSFINLYDLLKVEIKKNEKDIVWNWINFNELIISGELFGKYFKFIINNFPDKIFKKSLKETEKIVIELKNKILKIEDELKVKDGVNDEYLMWIRAEMGYE